MTEKKPSWLNKQTHAKDFRTIEAEHYDEYEDFKIDEGCYVHSNYSPPMGFNRVVYGWIKINDKGDKYIHSHKLYSDCSKRINSHFIQEKYYYVIIAIEL